LYIARELCEANGTRLSILTSKHGGHFVLQGKGEPWQQETNDELEAN
jgi:hypothetical protein